MSSWRQGELNLKQRDACGVGRGLGVPSQYRSPIYLRRRCNIEVRERERSRYRDVENMVHESRPSLGVGIKSSRRIDRHISNDRCWERLTFISIQCACVKTVIYALWMPIAHPNTEDTESCSSHFHAQPSRHSFVPQAQCDTKLSVSTARDPQNETLYSYIP